jgi:hypothetical protein
MTNRRVCVSWAKSKHEQDELASPHVVPDRRPHCAVLHTTAHISVTGRCCHLLAMRKTIVGRVRQDVGGKKFLCFFPKLCYADRSSYSQSSASVCVRVSHSCSRLSSPPLTEGHLWLLSISFPKSPPLLPFPVLAAYRHCTTLCGGLYTLENKGKKDDACKGKDHNS